MTSRIALISDDTNFFDYIKTKLELRKSDEVFTFCFDDVPDKINFLKSSVIVVNSECSNKKTLDLLKIFNYCTPIIITAFNTDEKFKKKCYRAGMFDYITLLTPDSEFRARMLPALNLSSLLQKNEQYRSLLVKKKFISKNNEIYINYEDIIDNVLENLKETPVDTVFAIISPKDKEKYLINTNSIETFLINNVRKNDIIMKYTPNKYCLFLYNNDITSAKKHWNKIISTFQYKLYAGFVAVKNQNRQQLLSNAILNLNKALEDNSGENIKPITSKQKKDSINNFKLKRKNMEQKLDILITPVFYRILQKYSNRLSGVKIEQNYGDGQGNFVIIGKHTSACFEITSPGFSKINIVITLKKDDEEIESKRFAFEIDEFDSSLLEDLLEQFISEAKNYVI